MLSKSISFRFIKKFHTNIIVLFFISPGIQFSFSIFSIFFIFLLGSIFHPQEEKNIKDVKESVFQKETWKGFFANEDINIVNVSKNKWIISIYKGQVMGGIPGNSPCLREYDRYEDGCYISVYDYYVFNPVNGEIAHILRSGNTRKVKPIPEYDDNSSLGGQLLEYFKKYESVCIKRACEKVGKLREWEDCVNYGGRGYIIRDCSKIKSREEQDKCHKSNEDVWNSAKTARKYNICRAHEEKIEDYTLENCLNSDITACHVKNYNNDPNRKYPIIKIHNNEILADSKFQLFLINGKILYNKKLNTLMQLPNLKNPLFLISNLSILTYSYKDNHKYGGYLRKVILYIYNTKTKRYKLYKIFYFKDIIKNISISPNGKFLALVTEVDCNEKFVWGYKEKISKRIRSFCDESFYTHFEHEVCSTKNKGNPIIQQCSKVRYTSNKFQALWLISVKTKRKFPITDNFYKIRYSKTPKYCGPCYKDPYKHFYQYYRDNIPYFLPSSIESIRWDYKGRKILFIIKPTFTPQLRLWFYFYVNNRIHNFLLGKNKFYNKPNKLFKVYLAQKYSIGEVDKENKMFYPIQTEVLGFYGDNKIIIKLYTDLCNERKIAERSVILYGDTTLGKKGCREHGDEDIGEICGYTQDNPTNFHIFILPLHKFLQEVVEY